MSSDDDNKFYLYGKLLAPIQEDEIFKRKDAEQQFVKDENGRRRFHGAFTGGFSAGFYNTVGSLEGWIPSTFQSSRDSKSTLRTQSAYDFMDEEDKRDLGVDSSSLKIKLKYSDHSTRKRQLSDIHIGPIPGKPVLGEILKPISDTWGVELLKSMGWKPGQGVGPQLTQREKFQAKKEFINVGMKLNTYTKHYDDDEDDDGINDLFGNIKVSPFEYESVAVKPKIDTFGLGYEGLKTTNVTEKSTNKYTKLIVEGKSIHGQAFGVGAYEEDDDDIYATEDMKNYDFSLEDKCQKSKYKIKSNNLNSKCIDGFVEDGTKHSLLDQLPLSTQIPPEWRPQGKFAHIFEQCPSDFYSQSSKFTNTSSDNVNTRQREMKKPELPSSDKQLIKKELPSLLSNIISDRFTKAVLPDDSTTALIPVVRTTDPTLQRLKDYADKKIFGFWTRKTELWIPDKLLCKRFNVPVPKQSMINYTNDGKKYGESSLFNCLDVSSLKSISVNEIQIPNYFSLTINDVNQENNKNIKLEENVSETNLVCDTPKSEKPSDDFFKAIFLDDSDDETPIIQNSLKSESMSTSYNEKNTSSIKQSSPKLKTSENVPNNTPFNLFPPQGIFANLNFDELFDTSKNDKQNKVGFTNKNQNNNVNTLYGPSLPELNKNITTNSICINSIQNTLVEDEWIEKPELSNDLISSHKKKHSKKHKHKSKKKSHKHK